MAVGLQAQSGEAVLTGVVKDYAGQDTLFCYFGSATAGYDTIAIREDGTFRLVKPMEAEKSVLVFYEGRGARNRNSFDAVMAPGRTLHVEVAPRSASPDSVVLETVFSGEGAVKSEFTNLFNYYFTRSYEMAAEALEPLADFNACRAYVGERLGKLSAILVRESDTDFVEKEKVAVAQAGRNAYFTFAKAKEQSGTKMENDAGFMKFVENIDMNDTARISDICNYLAWHYVAHPSLYKPLSPEAAQLKHLKAVVSDQRVRNEVANRYMLGMIFMMQFGAEPAKDVLEQYLDVATDTTYRDFVQNRLDVIKRSEPGQPAIDFPVNTLEGKEVGFKSLVGGGKVVYIDFWATWCMPCRREIPYLAKLAEYYKDNDRVRIISVSIDTDVAAWKKMIAADKPAWEQYNIPNPDDSEGVKHYNITGIPRFILFDREGKLCRFSASRPSDEATKALIDSLIK